MIDHKICPACGSKSIRKVRRTLNRAYHGEAYRVPNVEFHECPDCGEQVFSPEAVDLIESHRPTRKRAIA
jgi:YgiT-type zinc finger domain-containing protein